VSGEDKVIMQENLLETIEKSKQTMLEWFMMAKNVAEHANDSGAYGELEANMKKIALRRRCDFNK